MEKRDLKIGDIVQVSPCPGSLFEGVLMIITKPELWGGVGGIYGLAGAVYYYSCTFENMEYIGRAKWAQVDDREHWA